MIVLIDDERSFRDPPRNLVLLRNSKSAIAWLTNEGKELTIHELWLDHDLGLDENGNKDSILPFVRKVEELAFFGETPDIKCVVVHTSNPVGGSQVEAAMSKLFRTVRVYAGDHLVVKD